MGMCRCSECINLVEMPGKGRGVVAVENIPKDTIVNESPVVIYDDYLEGHKHIEDYEFLWGDEKVAMAFGIISFVNHSETPNCEIIRNFDRNTITIKTVVDIKASEELTFRYKTVWFDIVT